MNITQSNIGTEAPDLAQKMIDERARRFAVSMKALELMQAHYNNRYYSFKMVTADEEARWYARAEALVPPCSS